MYQLASVDQLHCELHDPISSGTAPLLCEQGVWWLGRNSPRAGMGVWHMPSRVW